MKKRAFIIYECATGWCYEATTVRGVREYPEDTHSFSKLSQLTKHLEKSVSRPGECHSAPVRTTPVAVQGGDEAQSSNPLEESE